MADDKKSQATTKTDSKATGDGGQGEVQKALDTEQDKGFRGERTDPTPLENYTVAGVTSGAPTPETDKDAADKARDAVFTSERKH